MKTVWGAVAALSLVATLAGCSGEPAPKVTVTAPESTSAEPSPSPTSSPSPSDVAPLPPGNLFDGRVGFTATATQTADTSTDSAGNTVSYDVINVTDGDPATAWRKATERWDGGGDYLLITFDQPVTLTSVGLIPGYAKVDPESGVDRFTQNYRLAYANWTFSDGSTWSQDFEDKPTMQTIPVAGEVTWIRIDNLWPGYPAWDQPPPPREYLAISDVAITGSVADS